MYSVLEGVKWSIKILVYMAHKSSGHMHDNMVAVGMHWKVMHAV